MLIALIITLKQYISHCLAVNCHLIKQQGVLFFLISVSFSNEEQFNGNDDANHQWCDVKEISPIICLPLKLTIWWDDQKIVIKVSK